MNEEKPTTHPRAKIAYSLSIWALLCATFIIVARIGGVNPIYTGKILLLFPIAGFILGLAAIIYALLAFVAIKKINKQPDQSDLPPMKTGKAILGFICGSISIFISFILGAMLIGAYYSRELYPPQNNPVGEIKVHYYGEENVKETPFRTIFLPDSSLLTVVLTENKADSARYQLFLLKTTLNGDELFYKPIEPKISDVIPASDNTVLFTAFELEKQDSTTTLKIGKLSFDGEIISIKSYPKFGRSWRNAGFISTLDGNYLLCFTTKPADRSEPDTLRNLFVMKVDVDGDSLWMRTYPTYKDEDVNDIVQTKEGDFILPFSIKTKNDETGKIARILHLQKLDSGGNLVWRKTYGDSIDFRTKKIYEHDDGTFYLIGKLYSPRPTQGALLKFNRQGDFLSEKRMERIGYFFTYFVDLAPWRENGLLILSNILFVEPEYTLFKGGYKNRNLCGIFALSSDQEIVHKFYHEEDLFKPWQVIRVSDSYYLIVGYGGTGETDKMGLVKTGDVGIMHFRLDQDL